MIKTDPETVDLVAQAIAGAWAPANQHYQAARRVLSTLQAHHGQTVYEGPWGLSPRQLQVLTAIQDLVALQGGASPTHDQIGQLVGLKSKSAVNRHLEELEVRGYIARIGGRKRSIKLLVPMPTIDRPDPITAIIGGHARILRKVYGDKPLFVPERVHKNHPITKCVGLECATALAKHFGPSHIDLQVIDMG